MIRTKRPSTVVPVESKFTRTGFEYTLQERVGNVAIYMQYDTCGEVVLGYEVVVIKVRQATELFGKKYPTMELYPSTIQWGYLGFTCKTLEEAELKMAELLYKEEK